MVEVNYGVPAGMVMHFTAARAPQGWLECDGSDVSIKEYYNLYEVIGSSFGEANSSDMFKLPDLRGEFIRSYDKTASIDEKRELGSKQEDALQGHNIGGGNFELYMYHKTGAGRALNNSYLVQNATAGSAGQFFTPGSLDKSLLAEIISDGVNGTPRVEKETRPRNMVLLACIKF